MPEVAYGILNLHLDGQGGHHCIRRFFNKKHTYCLGTRYYYLGTRGLSRAVLIIHIPFLQIIRVSGIECVDHTSL